MARLGIGLIGVGKHGSRYAHHIIQDLPGIRLVALARRNLELGRQQATAFDCRAYADFRDLMAAPDVDAVIAVVPPTLHGEIIETAAALRRPLLLEKPAATSVAEGRRMLHAMREARIPVMVAQTLRYNGVVRAVLSAREQIGRLHSLTVSQHFEPSRPGWIDDPAVAGGGVIMNTGVHSFDLVRLLSRLEAERISCEASAIRTAQTEDNFSALIRLSDGTALASITGSRATASRSGAIELAGEHGQLIADHLLNTASLVRGASVTPVPLPPPVATVRAAVADFASALDRGAAMPIPLEEGLRAVAIAEACYRAARMGQAVPVERI
jgi:predicted dehydrogenase